jgi:hypothetical protein
LGGGYGDGDLDHTCVACGTRITRQLLSVAKFIRDANYLVEKGRPMPGTILTAHNGLPHLVPDDPNASCRVPRTISNRLVRYGVHARLAGLIKPGTDTPPTMQTVRDIVSEALKDPLTLRFLRRPYDPLARHGGAASYVRLANTEKGHIRKMMSKYWENSSPFSLDLSAAVMRQGAFVEKMCQVCINVI